MTHRSCSSLAALQKVFSWHHSDCGWSKRTGPPPTVHSKISLPSTLRKWCSRGKTNYLGAITLNDKQGEIHCRLHIPYRRYFRGYAKVYSSKMLSDQCIINSFDLFVLCLRQGSRKARQNEGVWLWSHVVSIRQNLIMASHSFHFYGNTVDTE